MEQIIEVNEAICEGRPAAGSAAGDFPSGTGGEKGGLWEALAAEKAADELVAQRPPGQGLVEQQDHPARCSDNHDCETAVRGYRRSR